MAIESKSDFFATEHLLSGLAQDKESSGSDNHRTKKMHLHF
ncbi:Clp protease N-terminal domain-containing protein [Fredinandcohnia humi]